MTYIQRSPSPHKKVKNMIKQKAKILADAEAYTGVSRSVIMGRSRKNDVVMIRDAVCVAMKRVLGLTDEGIARSVGRERSFISYAHRRHEKRIAKVEGYKGLYNHLINKAHQDVA